MVAVVVLLLLDCICDARLLWLRRALLQGHRQHLLSFEGSDVEEDTISLPQEPPPAAGAGNAQHDSLPPKGEARSGIGQATAAKFKAEARQAAAARFKFHPSSSSAVELGSNQQQQQQQGPGLIDEDSSALQQQAQPDLSQIHFGMAQVSRQQPL